MKEIKIPKILEPMAEEARKYDTVKAFEKDFGTVLDKLHQEVPPKGPMGYGTNMLSKYGFDIKSFWEVTQIRLKA